MIVGVTGIYCSGKNEAVRVFESEGFRVVDVDIIGHMALDVKKEEILEAFGGDVLKEGGIDRKALGKIIFRDPQKKKLLERIVHPWMVREVKKIIGSGGDFVINAAILIEMCLHVLCDYVLGIEIDEKIALDRAVKRDDIPEQEARIRIASQIPLKEKLHYVDKVIENNGTLEYFINEVKSFIFKIKHGIR